MPAFKTNLTVCSLQLSSHPLVHLQLSCFAVLHRYGERQYNVFVVHGCEVELENEQSDIVEIVVLGKTAYCCQRRVRIRKPASYSQKFLWLAAWCWINNVNAFFRSYSHFSSVCLECYLRLFLFFVSTLLCTAQSQPGAEIPEFHWNWSILIAVRMISCCVSTQYQANTSH